jgi:hypothetical protein
MGTACAYMILLTTSRTQTYPNQETEPTYTSCSATCQNISAQPTEHEGRLGAVAVRVWISIGLPRGGDRRVQMEFIQTMRPRCRPLGPRFPAYGHRVCTVRWGRRERELRI